MGRPRKSNSLNVLHGNPGRRDTGASVPFVAAKVQPPSWLCGEAAIDEWRRVTAELQKQGRLAETDEIALAMYCDAVALYRRASIQLSHTDGPIMVGARGGLCKNPWANILHEAFIRIKAMCAEFGLTPLSRERLSPPTPPIDPKRAKFFGS